MGGGPSTYTVERYNARAQIPSFFTRNRSSTSTTESSWTYDGVGIPDGGHCDALPLGWHRTRRGLYLSLAP